jgi:hypothetical protein
MELYLTLSELLLLQKQFDDAVAVAYQAIQKWPQKQKRAYLAVYLSRCI